MINYVCDRPRAARSPSSGLLLRILLSLTVMLIGISVQPPLARANRQPYLTPAGLETCEGGSWSGLVLGKTQQGELHRMFRCGRGDLDSSVEIQQPKGSPVRIDALFASHKKEAALLAICLHYTGSGPDLAVLQTTLAPSVSLYDRRERYEDWRVVAFPSAGILAFTITDNGQTVTPLVVLTSPAAVASLSKSLTSDFQPVVTRIDPNVNKPRVLLFGSATADFSLDRPFVVKPSEVSDVERTMQEETAGGAMRYVNGADGAYTTSVQLSYDAKRGGTLSVSCRISGDGPYTPISVSDEETASVPAANAAGVDPSWSYTALLLKAQIAVAEQLRSAMRDQGPPPIEVLRANRRASLVEDVRRASAAGPGDIGTPAPPENAVAIAPPANVPQTPAPTIEPQAPVPTIEPPVNNGPESLPFSIPPPPPVTIQVAPPRSEPAVAAVDDDTITLNVGAAEGLRIGDRVGVQVPTDILDPTTHAVLETRTRQVILRVIRAGTLADCVAVNAKYAPQVSSIKPGMKIKSWHVAAAPAQKKP